MTNELYLSAHQSRAKAPTAAEDALADAIERCFARGIVDIGAIVAELNKLGVPSHDGLAWSSAALSAELKRLGA